MEKTRLARIHYRLYEEIEKEQDRTLREIGVKIPFWLASKFYFEKNKGKF